MFPLGAAGLIAAGVKSQLVRLAERDHAKASRMFQQVTNHATFTWSQDGEALLHRHKPSWYARPQLPRIVVLNDRLSPHLAVS